MSPLAPKEPHTIMLVLLRGQPLDGSGHPVPVYETADIVREDFFIRAGVYAPGEPVPPHTREKDGSP
jgi:hypothetical protein